MRRRAFVSLLGGAAVWPVVARSQQPMPSVGLLVATSNVDWALSGFRKGLDEAGFVEGRNLTIVYRSAEGQLDRLPELATDLVNRQVSVIFATGGPVPARAAKAATSALPIVFAYGGDPVADGLVTSFNRPEANVTGATFIGSSLLGKRAELLRDIVPKMTDVALLVNPKGTLADSQIRDMKAAVQVLGLRLHVVNGSSESEVDEAFATMDRSKVNAVLVGIDPLFGFVLSKRIVALASRYSIPAIYDARTYPDSGGMISYGPNLSDTWRQAGVYVGRILKGEKPSELPVMQPTKFEMVINLKTAKALGVEIPPKLLFTADEVIE